MENLKFECDVLVAGGGPAALFAAIKAARAGAKVIVASKGVAGASGPSCTPNHGGIGAFFPGLFESKDLLRIATEHATFMNDQELNKVIIEKNWEIVQEWIGYGADFAKRDGEFVWTSIGRAYPHVHGVGKEYMRVLRTQCDKIQNVSVIDRLMVTDVLTSDGAQPTNGRISGAVGLHVRTGDFYEFHSKAVVLATGGWCIPSSYSNQTADISGDGKAIGLRAGSVYRAAGTLTFALATPGSGTASSLGYKLALSGRFVNDLGENIDAKMRQAHAQNRWIDTPRLAYQEIQKGRQIYLDYTGLDAESIGLMAKTIKPQMAAWNQHGLALPGVIPMTVVLGGDGGAGLMVDSTWSTNIPGLYAAGETQGSFYGPGSGVAGAAVQGAIAGESAARYAFEAETPLIDPKQAETLKQEIYSSYGRSGPGPSAVREKLHSITMQNLILANEEGLIRALREIEKIKSNKMHSLGARNPHELKTLLEVKNIIFILEVIVRASLLRKESRAGFYRDDYPKRDDSGWLKWALARARNDGEVEIWFEDVPLPYFGLVVKKNNEVPRIDSEAEKLAG